MRTFHILRRGRTLMAYHLLSLRDWALYTVPMLPEPSASMMTYGPSTRFKAQSRNDNKWYRSEEHTAELQSSDHIVCRLLLEKKNRLLATPASLLHPSLPSPATLGPFALRYTLADGRLCSQDDYYGENNLQVALLFSPTARLY